MRHTEQTAAASTDKLIFAPARLMVVLICSVFIVELLVMMLLSLFPELPDAAANVIDSSILVALLFPVLYRFVLKPLLRLLEDYRAKGEELAAYREVLEQKVEQRTRELSEAMRLMELEMAERRKVEEATRELQGRLVHANRMTSLGTLVSSVAHEINNPSNYILINAGVLKQLWRDVAALLEERYREEGDFEVGRSSYTEVREVLPDLCDGIVDGAQRITAIVENLKRFGREDRRGTELPVDVNEAVSLACAMLNHHVSRYTRRFLLETAPDLPPVRGNLLQLEQVAINLITNALQALRDPEGEVRVSTSVGKDGAVLLQVSDTGRGIPEELAARIMEPFFTTRLEEGGTGLGLAITSALVKESGGRLEFESEPGRGTTFTVRLVPFGPPGDPSGRARC